MKSRTERRSSRWLRLALVAVTGVALLGGLASTQIARAIEIDEDGRIEADEVIDDDVFIAAENVVVDGTVNGVLFVSANSAEINGTVNGDLVILGAEGKVSGLVTDNLAFAGRYLEISSDIGGSLFATGTSLALEPASSIGRNVLFAGFNLEMEPESTIGRDLRAACGQAILNGQVGRDVYVDTGAFDLDGTIGRDVEVHVPEPTVEGETPPSFIVDFFSEVVKSPPPAPSGIRVAESAQIDGTLTYYSPQNQDQAILASPAGGVSYVHEAKKEPKPQQNAAVRFVANRVRDLLTLLILGALIGWQLPQFLDRAAEQTHTRWLPALGWGVVVLIAGFVAAFLLALAIFVLGILLGVVTLDGLSWVIFGVGFSSLGLGFTLFMLAVTYGSKLVVAYLAGRFILQTLGADQTDRAIATTLVGVLAYIVVRSIPFLGGLIGFIFTLFGLGGLWLAYKQWKQDQPEPESQAAEPTPEDVT